MATTAPVSSLHQLQTLFPTSLLLDAHALAGVLGIAHKTLNNAGEAGERQPKPRPALAMPAAAWLDRSTVVGLQKKGIFGGGWSDKDESLVKSQQRGRGR